MAIHSSTLAWRIPIDRGGWWATVHRVTKSWTRLSALAHTAHIHHNNINIPYNLEYSLFIQFSQASLIPFSFPSSWQQLICFLSLFFFFIPQCYISGIAA